jgi:hypothetical protein
LKIYDGAIKVGDRRLDNLVVVACSITQASQVKVVSKLREPRYIQAEEEGKV